MQGRACLAWGGPAVPETAATATEHASPVAQRPHSSATISSLAADDSCECCGVGMRHAWAESQLQQAQQAALTAANHFCPGSRPKNHLSSALWASASCRCMSARSAAALVAAFFLATRATAHVSGQTIGTSTCQQLTMGDNANMISGQHRRGGGGTSVACAGVRGHQLNASCCMPGMGEPRLT